VAQLTLVLGGVRSGKSRFAERLAAEHPPVTYLATARPGDPEFAARIARHRERRPPEWRTIEEPWHVARTVTLHAAAGCLLVECLPLWLTNCLVGLPGNDPRDDAAIIAEVEALATAGREAVGRIVVVSGEVGCGILPANALARRFADVLGEANQRLAAAADEVYLCTAGIAVRIK
jgi:adenosylcobinamide kinase/adenosylcobinamide-phosphate guanylyltransferase